MASSSVRTHALGTSRQASTCARTSSGEDGTFQILGVARDPGELDQALRRKAIPWAARRQLLDPSVRDFVKGAFGTSRMAGSRFEAALLRPARPDRGTSHSTIESKRDVTEKAVFHLAANPDLLPNSDLRKADVLEGVVRRAGLIPPRKNFDGCACITAS